MIDAVAGEVGHATANLTIRNQTASAAEATVTVRQVHLDNGGFVAIHDTAPSGPVIGVSNHLQPGTHDDVTIRLRESPTGPVTLVAMALHDSDCNRLWGWPTGDSDRPYVENGTPARAVADAATVEFPTATPSPSPTPSPTPLATPSPTPSPTDPATPTETPEGTMTTGPGFDVGVTLVAVVSAVILLWRNR